MSAQWSVQRFPPPADMPEPAVHSAATKNISAAVNQTTLIFIRVMILLSLGKKGERSIIGNAADTRRAHTSPCLRSDVFGICEGVGIRACDADRFLCIDLYIGLQ